MALKESGRNMLNKDKYKDELIKNFIMDGDCGLRDVYDKVIYNCVKSCDEDHCDDCRKMVLNWLFEEEHND